MYMPWKLECLLDSDSLNFIFCTAVPAALVIFHLSLLLHSYTGVVQYWHTPFGDLQTPGLHSKLDPVFMHHDGNLVVPNISSLHNGLYYCLLQHTAGMTLWPYELHVGYDHQKNQEHGQHEHSSGCDTFRFRRDVGSEEEEKQAGVSDGQFAGAVAASVLLTFVLGFSAGALSRAHVLRCVQTIDSPQFRERICSTKNIASHIS